MGARIDILTRVAPVPRVMVGLTFVNRPRRAYSFI
jgi:hypothetical protein